MQGLKEPIGADFGQSIRSASQRPLQFDTEEDGDDRSRLALQGASEVGR